MLSGIYRSLFLNWKQSIILSPSCSASQGRESSNGNTIAEIERIIFVVWKGTPHHKKLSLYVVVEIALLQAVCWCLMAVAIFGIEFQMDDSRKKKSHFKGPEI